jgi:hypothetical protein
MVNVELLDLRKLADALAALADCIAKFGDSIAHLVQLGAKGWDAASARVTRNRLYRLQRELIALHGPQSVAYDALQDYIRVAARSPLDAPLLRREWQIVLSLLRPLTFEVYDLVEALRNESSEFVLEKSYNVLLSTLQMRSKIFEDLMNREPPCAGEELSELKKIDKAWSRLRSQFFSAMDQSSEYLRLTQKE